MRNNSIVGDNLPNIKTEKKSGKESFQTDNEDLPFSVLNFWQWYASDLLDNTTRGFLAEFLVAQALGQTGTPRVEWDAYDVKTDSGIKVEVKSASYIQSWEQSGYSKISFNISSTQGWEADSNTYSDEKIRQADVYVFCLLHYKDQKTIDPLNLDQWAFYVISTKRLNEKVGNQKSIALSRLVDIGATKVEFDQLEEAIQGFSIFDQ